MGEIVSLSIDLLERLGFLAVLFFLMMRFEQFQRLLTGRATGREKLFHAVYFGVAGIFATYCGFPVHGAIANLRTVPVVIGGILGGPLVGLSTGIIAGVHRYFYDIGGVTSLPCAIATPLAGAVVGLLYRRLHRKTFDSLTAFFIGIVAESIKMGLILLLARPQDAGMDVVHAIGLPSILANAFGIAVLVELIVSVSREQERAMSQQALELQRRLLAEAEIKALQAQINPHFLFNAISTIISYTRTDPQTASSLLVKLADFFRKNISPTAKEVPLSVELEHCEAYIAIEKARFEERLSIVYEIDDEALSCNVSSLVLQPLVENGVRHGILPKECGGVIHIGAKMDDNALLLIYVKDNGVGMSQERICSLLSETTSTYTGNGLGLALRNVNSRLTTLYGKDKGLIIESEPGAGTTVHFCIPVGA